MSLYLRIKKYLFLLACAFAIVTGAHIATLYLFDGAQAVPEKGGTLSIGVIGSAPSLNPTQYGLDENDDFALRFLYRGLLRYDPSKGTVQGDLANCDLSQGYAEIRCFFKPGSTWSTGGPITQEDVLATYSLLAETDTNKQLESALSKLQVTSENGAIVFRSPTASSELLPLLTIPILKADIAEKYRDGTPGVNDVAYSGPYSFEKRETESVGSADRLTFARNDNATGDFGYAKVILRFFPDAQTLQSQSNGLNFVFPDKSLPDSPSSRFDAASFVTPDVVGVFANTEKLSVGMRSLLLSLATEAEDESLSSAKLPVKNPFFTDETIVGSMSGVSLEKKLAELGYFRKAALLDMAKSSTGNVAQTPVPSTAPSA